MVGKYLLFNTRFKQNKERLSYFCLQSIVLAMKKILLLLGLGFSLTAYSQNLVLDETFNVGTGTDFRVNDIHVLEGGKILIAGNFNNYNGHPAPGIARLNSDGSFDDTFSVNLTSNNFNEIIVEEDGKILAVGEFSGIYRFNSDGTADASFTPPSLTTGGYGPANIAKQGDKYIVTGGFSVVVSGTGLYTDILRLNNNGTVDTGFALSGMSDSFDFGKILVQEDGKLFIAGKFTYYGNAEVNNLMRLTANGQLDTTFNAGSGPAGMVREAIQLPDGKYIVSGQFESYNGEPVHLMVKLNNDGTKDNSFTYMPNVGLPEDGIIGMTIILQDDGKLLVSGDFKDAMQSIEGTPDGSVPVYVCRLNADGSVDPGFAGGNKFNGSVNVIAFQQDEKMLAGGMFYEFAGASRKTIARFTQEVLSVDENDMNMFKAYPNPVSQMLYFDGVQDSGVVTVYNMLGSTIYKSTFTEGSSLDMSGFTNGLYIVKLESGDKVFTQKIIKQ